MQLDRTRIAIRERDVLDTLDLSLHVLRTYALPLLATMAMGVIPLMILNHLLLGWFADTVDNELDYPFRFVWLMSALVLIEAPLASIFATSYLGQAVFLDRPRLWEVFLDVGKMLPRIVWCQLLIRGIAPAWLLLFFIERHGGFAPAIEGFLFPALLIYIVAVRAFRPYMNEIVLLERNPLASRNSRVMTIGRRSTMLHSVRGGDLLARWLGSALIGGALVMSVYGTALFTVGTLLNDWSQGPFMTRFCLPLSMWLVCGYLTVFRFLSYLDLRIRQEGWEVELRLRAEASRLTSSIA